MIPLSARLSLFLATCFAALLCVLRLEARQERPAGFSDCAMSCWQGLQPGVTSESGALEQLNALYGFEPIASNCIDKPPPNDCALYTWRGEGAPRTTELTVDHGIVQSVMIYPGSTLGDILLALNAEFSGAASYRFASGFAMQLGFAQSRFSITLNVPCPLSYAALLRRTVTAIVIGQPSNLPDRYSQSFADVRQSFHRSCHA